jgi:hypothetical protein
VCHNRNTVVNRLYVDVFILFLEEKEKSERDLRRMIKLSMTSHRWRDCCCAGVETRGCGVAGVRLDGGEQLHSARWDL